MALRVCILMATLVSSSANLLPVFFMHGVGGAHSDFNQMEAWLKEVEPNMTVYNLHLYDYASSFVNLWTQAAGIIDAVRERVKAEPETYKGGYSFVCHSQGALLCRSVIELMDDHNVHTFISLAGPHRGEFGIPDIQVVIPGGRDLAHTFFYTQAFQKDLSLANYWTDPRPVVFSTYLARNTFLPVLNNNPGRGTQGPGLPKNDTEAARYKANFIRLRKAVFLCSPADKVIVPFDSGIFNFYDGTAAQTVPLEHTPLWSEDWIGLRTLNDSRRLLRVTAPDACHTCWQSRRALFDEFVLPHLPINGGVEVAQSILV